MRGPAYGWIWPEADARDRRFGGTAMTLREILLVLAVSVFELSVLPSASGQGADIDPCALVTQPEIEQILGFSISGRQSSIEMTEGVTFYSCSSDDIHLDIEVWDDAANASMMFEFGLEYPEIGGVGDQARNTQPLGEIDVLLGRYVVSVDIYSNLDSSEEIRVATEIARIAVGRLP
jgi:hypothetical protein